MSAEFQPVEPIFFHTPPRWRAVALTFTAIGVLAVLVAILAGHNPERIMASLLTSAVYFLGIGLAGMVFLTTHRLGRAGWHTVLQRIPEAIAAYVPVGGLILIVLIVVGLFGMHHPIYEWAHKELYDPTSPHYDELLAKKLPYLNVPFFLMRTVAFVLIWSGFVWWWRRLTYLFDTTGNLHYWNRQGTLSGLFVVVFAITGSFAFFDWVMSLEPHWYSTLFAWYNFASYWVAGIALMTLLTVLIREKNLNPHIHHEHYHDLGKYMFGFSIFWAYLFFSQYMLIWYANIPEETAYFIKRLFEHRFLFYSLIVICFFVPFFGLMTRHSKRNARTLTIMAVIILLGHWLDYWFMVEVGLLGKEAAIGWLELGVALGFAGIFLLVVFRALEQLSLIPVNHPLIVESLSYRS